MRIVERLNNKKSELEGRLSSLYQGGSQRRETLQYRIKKIKELIEIYQSSLKTSDSVNLSEAEQILSQQVGFEEQKEVILNNLKIADFCQKHNIRRNPQILCLIGPPGVGKTTFAQIFADSLKKKIFSITLGGLSDASILLGTSENSSGVEIGQLTRSLVETKSSDPLILLEEIDKVAFASQSSIHGILTAVLDPVQNHEILDYYLEVKLDFSQAIFVVTANETQKIPPHLRSRMLIVELGGYSEEQKRKIAELTIQKWFAENINLDRHNFEITSEAVETLIKKTRERGVRQLKAALEKIFDYSLLQWWEAETKIIITPNLINKLFPHPFSNLDQNDQSQLIVQSRRESWWDIEGNPWFVLFVSNLVAGAIYGMFKLKNWIYYHKAKNSVSSE